MNICHGSKEFWILWQIKAIQDWKAANTFLDLLKANWYHSASYGKKWKWWFWKIYNFHKLYVSLTRVTTWGITFSFATIQSFICPIILILWAVYVNYELSSSYIFMYSSYCIMVLRFSLRWKRIKLQPWPSTLWYFKD